jgi:energy-coupling factor transporter ATP-binding protein EcfA2
VDKGEFVSLMGHSGCSKSTMLNILGLIDKIILRYLSEEDTPKIVEESFQTDILWHISPHIGHIHYLAAYAAITSYKT